MNNAITLRDLTKRYGGRAAGQKLTINERAAWRGGRVRRKAIWRMRARARSAARHPESDLGRVGALVESPAFYPALMGAENLAAPEPRQQRPDSGLRWAWDLSRDTAATLVS
jgi:hypothetical protein